MYGIGESIFRLGVFQNGAGADTWYLRFFRWFGGASDQKTCSPVFYDAKRAEKSLEDFKRLGAEETFVTPEDQQATIHVLTLKARDLERKLTYLGASWEKRGEKLVIIPPQDLSSEWKELESCLVKKLKWEKEMIIADDEGEIEVIVTCQKAESIEEEHYYQKCFLHVNSGSVTLAMLGGRAGWYLGFKQDICFFDPRGTGKSLGSASEGGYYNDIESVYHKVVEEEYASKNVWVSGACRGVMPAAYLKAHLNGRVNLILENGFGDLRADFIAQESWIVRTFVDRYWDGLKCQDFVSPKETGFSVPRLWESLQEQHGKVIIINVENDQRLPPSVADDLVGLARNVSRKVHPFSFQSADEENPHFDRYYNYPDVSERVAKVVLGIA